MARPGLTGALLVGGASTRFGSPKALALLGGRTLAERAWDVLGELCDERIAVGKVADGLPLPFPLVDDGSDVRAPIAGVAAAVRAARHDVCVVLPVDMPFLTSDALGALAEACVADVEVAVTQAGPLPAAYRRSALPVLEDALASERFALRDAVQRLRAVVVECDSALLVNVNEAVDLARLS